MTKRALIPILLVSSLAWAQSLFSYSDPSGGLSVKAKSGILTQEPGPVYRIRVKTPGGQVQVTSKSQGLEMYAQEVDLRTQPPELVKGGLMIKSATASGRVRVLRNGGGMRTELTGGTAKFSAAGSTANLVMAGPVRITGSNAARRQTFSGTGNSLSASLTNSTSGDPLRSATLSGNVKVQVRQGAETGSPGTNLDVSSSRMVLNNMGTQRTITLTGGVRIRGKQGGSNLDATFDRAVLFLNRAGEVSRFEASSGGA